MTGISAEFLCPYCQQAISLNDPQPQLILTCRNCHQDFMLPNPALNHDPMEKDSDASQNDQLNATRIQNYSNLRKAIYRSRSHAIIAAIFCSVAAAELVMMTTHEALATGWSIRPIGYIALAAISVMGAWHFLGRAIGFNHTLRRTPAMQLETAKPDFSMLNDGSQRAGNLERIR